MGWQQLEQILKENAREAEEQRKRDMNPTTCPECAWPQLKKNSLGQLLCQICDWNNK